MGKIIKNTAIYLISCCSLLVSDTFAMRFQPLKKGHFSFAADYIFTRTDVETEKTSIGPIPLRSVTIRDIDLQRYFFVPSYAVLDNLTVFGRLGATQMHISESANEDNLAGQAGTSDWNLSLGAGARMVIYKKDRLSWGIAGQFSHTEFDGFNDFTTVLPGIGPVTGSMKLDLWEYQFSTGPAYELLDGWILSAGPFFEFIDAESRLKVPLDGTTLKSTVDIHEKDYFGAYISSQLMLTKSVIWNVRFSSVGDGFIIGTGISYAF